MSGESPSHPKDSPESLSNLSTLKLLLPEEDLEEHEASEQQHPSASAAAENADTDGDCKQDNERPHEPFYRATNSGLVAYSGTHTSVDMNQMFQIMNIHSPTCHARLHHHHGVFQKEFFINRVMDFQNNNNNIRISIPRHLQRAAEAIKEEVNSEYNPVDSTLDEANVQENPTDTKADTESADLSLNTFNFGPDTGLQDHAEIVIQGENPDVEEPANTQGEPFDTVSHSQLPTETQPCDTDVQDPDNITATASNGAEYAEQAIQAFPTTFGKSPPIERPRKVSFCGMDIDLEVPSTSWTDINLEGPIEASTSAEPEAEFKTPRPVRNSPGALKKNRLASVDKGKSTNGTKKGKASKNQRTTGEHANPNAETNADAENPESKEPDTDDEIKAAKIDPKKRKLMRKLSAIGIKRGCSYSYLIRKLSALEQAQRFSQQFQERQWRRLVATQRRQVALQLLAHAHAIALNNLLRKRWLSHWLQHLHF